MRSIIAVTAAVLVSVVLAACQPIDSTSSSGSVGPSNSAGPSDGASPSDSTSPPGTDPTAPPGTAGIGDTITLTDTDGLRPEHIAVTLVKVVLEASPSLSYISPQSGDEWVAVQFRVQNLDQAPYVDSPNSSASAVDVAGQSITAQDDAPTTVGPAFSDRLALTTGSTATGVVTFEMASGDNITTVMFTTDYGDGTDTGTWTIG